MTSDTQFEKKLGTLLRTGMLISTLLVLIGGLLFLAKYGHDAVPFAQLRHAPVKSSMMQVWQAALSFTPTGIIQLGLLTLVMTQLVRVAALLAYYASIRDNWFTVFCSFVLIVLIYSFT